VYIKDVMKKQNQTLTQDTPVVPPTTRLWVYHDETKEVVTRKQTLTQNTATACSPKPMWIENNAHVQGRNKELLDSIIDNLSGDVTVTVVFRDMERPLEGPLDYNRNSVLLVSYAQ